MESLLSLWIIAIILLAIAGKSKAAANLIVLPLFGIIVMFGVLVLLVVLHGL